MYPSGAFYLTLVPIRPRWRGERRSLRNFSPGASLRPHLAFNPDTPRRLSTPSDAFQLHPDVRSYGPSTLSPRRVREPRRVRGRGLDRRARRRGRAHGRGRQRGVQPDRRRADTHARADAVSEHARRVGCVLFFTPVPVRPRSRCELHSSRTFSPGRHPSPRTTPRLQRPHHTRRGPRRLSLPAVVVSLRPSHGWFQPPPSAPFNSN